VAKKQGFFFLNHGNLQILAFFFSKVSQGNCIVKPSDFDNNNCGQASPGAHDARLKHFLDREKKGCWL